MCFISEMVRLYLLWLLLLPAILPSVGDVCAANYKLRHYTVEKGLASNTVRALLQDRTGYIWVATTDGLTRFAGTHTETFRHDPDDPYSIGSNEIWSLAEDSQGRLWAGSKGKVYIFDAATERFQTFDDKGMFQSFAIFKSIVEDGNGNIWMGTIGDGLFRYDSRQDTLIDYTAQILSIRQLLVDHTGRLWALGEGKYLRLYSADTDEFAKIQIKDSNSGVTLNGGVDMCEDSQGNLWIAGFPFALVKLDRERQHFTFVAVGIPGKNVDRIRCIQEYKPGKLILGSNDGVIFYDCIAGHFEKIDWGRDNAYGLNDGFVHASLKDREGGLWLGTYFGGVNYLSPLSFCFELYQNVPSGGEDKHFIVSKFCEDEDGNIWIGSDNDGLGKYVPSTGVFTHVPVDKQKPALNIHALYAEGQELWIGTYLNGIYRMNRQTGKVRRYPYPGSITRFYRDAHGVLWTGTKDGAFRFDPVKDRFQKTIDPGLNCDVLDIAGDGKGNVWFASYGGGLIAWNALTDSVQRYYGDERQAGYVTNQTRALCFHRNRLWVGTSGRGLWYFDPVERKLSREFPDNELDLTTVYCIIPHDDHLWMTTNKGLARYNIGNGEVAWYNEENGLQGRLFNPNAGLKSSSGNIYIGGSRGFNVFDPNAVSENTYPPYIVFTDFKLFGKKVAVDSGGILRSHINVQRSLLLNARQNVFTIDFAALSYSTPSNTDYRYILEGFDQDWTEVRDNGVASASYMNLPSGKYTFKVKADNNTGKWIAPVAEISVTVLPPWWRTLWMELVYILLMLGGVLGFFWWLWHRMERRQMERLHELQQKNSQELLESKIRIFQEIAHEIRTPVTLIAAPAEEIIRSADLPEAVREDLEIIKKNSDRLVELMNQVLDFSRSESEYSRMSRRRVNVGEQLSGIIDRYRSIAKGKGIGITVNLHPDTPVFACYEAESFDKIVSNLMTNALKYTADRIDVELSCTDESFFALAIRDNGKGIEDKQKIFDLFWRSPEQKDAGLEGFGIGLAVVSLLLKKMGASIRVESEQGEGAAFYLEFPLDLLPDEEKGESRTEQAGETELPAGQTAAPDSAVVLIVEDNDSLRHFLAKSLRGFYQVRTAANGQEAVEILQQPDVDIIISDVVMPVMDGWELCRYIKDNVAVNHIPVVLLTARTDVDSKIMALENGADIYIEKPVVMKYLYAQIAQILDKRKQLREAFSNMPLEPISSLVKNEKEEEFICKVNQIVEENISNSEFSMDEIADRLYMSRSAMYAKIKAISGLTPNHFVRLIRLRKAAELFRSGKDYKINEVCYLVGFSSPSYFAKCFQQQFGMLPGDFINGGK